MKNKTLNPLAVAMIRRSAEHRGISSTGMDDYLGPKLDPGRFKLPGADKAANRLHASINRKESVVIYGDYAADGITSTAILLRFFTECTSFRPSWRLPDRRADHYGLDVASAKSIVANHKPLLLICVDSGTNSAEAASWLRSQGVDTVVVDHHPVSTLAAESVAIVNPKAH